MTLKIADKSARSRVLAKLCENFVYDFFNHKNGKNSMCSRFSDTGDTFQGKGKGVILPRSPSDFVITCDGKTLYAEVKSTVSEQGLSSSLFRQQEARRDRVLNCGGEYVYFVYSDAFKIWYRINGKIVKENPNRKWKDLADLVWSQGTVLWGEDEKYGI